MSTLTSQSNQNLESKAWALVTFTEAVPPLPHPRCAAGIEGHGPKGKEGEAQQTGAPAAATIRSRHKIRISIPEPQTPVYEIVFLGCCWLSRRLGAVWWWASVAFGDKHLHVSLGAVLQGLSVQVPTAWLRDRQMTQTRPFQPSLPEIGLLGRVTREQKVVGAAIHWNQTMNI